MQTNKTTFIPNRPNNKPNGKRFSNNFNEPLINDELRYRDNDEVRVVHNSRIKNEGFAEVMTFSKAKELSLSMELDLIEINTNANPPVLRLDDYNKFLWELKKNKDKKKTTSAVKEIQLSTNISLHDMETKANKAREFISDGDRVKVVLRMRGRELARREQSKESLRTFIKLMSDVAVVEGQVREEGQRSIALLRKK